MSAKSRREFMQWRGVTDCLMDCADLYPTFVELAGGDSRMCPELDGRSFKPLLDGHRRYSKPWMFSYLGLYRSIRNRDYYLDGAGRMWRCHPSGNPFEFKLIPREKESPVARTARRELETVLEEIPAPLYMVQDNPQALASYEKNRAGEICGRMPFADRIYQTGVKKLKANPERRTYHTN